MPQRALPSIVIPPRFCGPPGLGNGGYVCGRLAAIAASPIEVTLRRGVPLGRALEVVNREGGGLEIRDGEALLGEAKPSELGLEPPPPISFPEAEAAAKRHPRFVGHPVPGCFVCGPDRARGDGLRIFPGPLDGGEVWAAPWIPDASLAGENELVRFEFLWAALDCPGAFAVNEPPRGVALLGRLAAEIVGPVAVGERCVVLAWGLGGEGRKLLAGTALYGERGDVRACARATWILTSQVF